MSEQETFKAGEHVAVFSGFNDTPALATIERVTPSGILVIGNSQYSPNGRRRGDSGYGVSRIRKLTPELERKAIRARNLYAISSCNFNMFTDDELARLAGIITEIRKAKEGK